MSASGINFATGIWKPQTILGGLSKVLGGGSADPAPTDTSGRTYPQTTPTPLPGAYTAPIDPNQAAPAATPNAATDTLGNVASTAYGRATSKFYPLEDQLINKVQRYNSPAYAEEQEGKASADVATGFDQAAANQQASEESMGVNPGDGAHVANTRALQIARAGATAGAISKARGDAEDKAYNTLSDVSSRGNQDLSIATGAAGAEGNQILGSQQNNLAAQRNQLAWEQQQSDAELRSRGLQNQWDENQRQLDQGDVKNNQGQQGINNQGAAGTGSLIGAGLTAAAIFF